MGKQGDKDDPVEKARSKLAKAQLKLHAAEAKHAQAVERGKQEVERARLRAAEWEAKARERVERRANAVARLEARLISAEAHETDLQRNGVAPQPIDSPEKAAEVVERRGAKARGDGHGEPLIVPG
jgi:hypothetical protein